MKLADTGCCYAHGAKDDMDAHKPSDALSCDEDEEEEYDNDDDVVDDLPEFPKNYVISKGRHSVSAEVYGEWNKKQKFVPPVHEKTPEQKQRIKDVLLTSFLFQNLEQDDLHTILLAFTEKHLKAGEVLIRQGDDGDRLYLIEQGEVDVFKLLPGATEQKLMCVMVPGDAVGELALLYNCPRAATVIAKGDVVLWALDRETFNCIVKDAAARRRELYESFLKEVEILKDMDPYERSKLSDALKSVTFQPNTTIIQQAEIGDTFYIIESGSAVAFKDGKQVMEYGRGDFFGELALIRNQPRAATVKTSKDGVVRCVSLDRRSFKRLLGPVETILKRNAARYEQVCSTMAREAGQCAKA